MSKLQKLYNMIQYSKELNLPLSEEYLQQANELEEEIIKKEILPILTEKIEPVISQIQRELVLVVDYVPNEPLSVRISRKRNFTEQMETIEIVPDPQVEHNVGTIKRKVSGRAQNTNLRVKFPDGTVIENRFALDTLKQVVQRAGVDKVRELGIIQCGVPLISNTLDNAYSSSQKDIAKGWYLMTLSSTATKQQQIEKISNALNLNLKVEVL